MNRKLKIELEKIYSFMEEVYPANLKTRWGETPYMRSFVSQDELDKFVKSYGLFETVPGHVWACMLLYENLRRICPSLNKITDTAEVFARLLIHDIGETRRGDISLVAKFHYGKADGKIDERRDYVDIMRSLPAQIRAKFVKWFDEFEGNVNEEKLSLEVLLARWITDLQGDHFALTFGKNLPKYSEIVEKIVKKRSAARAKAIIEFLQEKTKTDRKSAQLYLAAAQEVKKVMKFHRDMIKKAGIRIDLTGLGF